MSGPRCRDGLSPAVVLSYNGGDECANFVEHSADVCGVDDCADAGRADSAGTVFACGEERADSFGAAEDDLRRPHNAGSTGHEWPAHARSDRGIFERGPRNHERDGKRIVCGPADSRSTVRNDSRPAGAGADAGDSGGRQLRCSINFASAAFCFTE